MADQKKIKLLIVGGTGFIGRRVSEIAIRKGYKVSVLSLSAVARSAMLRDVEYAEVNISNISELRNRRPLSFDYIINLAGYVDHGLFSESGSRTLDTHFFGLRNLLLSIEWDRLKRFVQIGSSDEYGNAPHPQHEESRESPISAYAVGKTAASHLLTMLARTENFPAVVLRLFLVYGPGQNSQRFLPQVLLGCLSGREFSVSGGEQIRDFCYVDDIAYGILRALEAENVNGEIINLASGLPVTIRSVIELAQSITRGGRPRYGEIPYRKCENMKLYADVSKAQSLLGWSPRINLEMGITKTIELLEADMYRTRC